MAASSGTDHYKFKHGLRKTKEFGIWWQMIQRCRNQKHKAYPRYGGRGIVVCERWQEFGNFLEDMGPKPDGLSLDRKDNDGNYEPSNCRWADSKTQSINRDIVKRYKAAEVGIMTEFMNMTPTRQIAAKFDVSVKHVNRVCRPIIEACDAGLWQPTRNSVMWWKRPE
jgi:hypothetical protein